MSEWYDKTRQAVHTVEIHLLVKVGIVQCLHGNLLLQFLIVEGKVVCHRSIWQSFRCKHPFGPSNPAHCVPVSYSYWNTRQGEEEEVRPEPKGEVRDEELE